MRLKEIVNSITTEKFTGDLDFNVESITQDSRKVNSKSLFIAIKGLAVDGHDFLNDIYKKGCRAIVVEKEIPEQENLNVIQVEDTNIALGKISSIFYNEPSKKMEMIGLTGTNGKTTISFMTKFLLEEKMTCASLGTNGLYIKKEKVETNLTTPTPEHLQKYLHLAVENNVETFIMEVSSHALESQRVQNVEFNISAFTNLSLDHLDFHKTMENYYQAKKKLFFMTKELAIINTEDAFGKRLYDEIKKEVGYKIVRIGETNQEICLLDYEILDGFSLVKLSIFGEKFKVKLPVETKYNIYNLMTTIAIGHHYNFEISNILKRLENFPGVEGRYQRVENDCNLNLIVDYAHSPDALENILASRKLDSGRKILVFGIAGDRQKEIREEMGRIAGKLADVLFITADDVRVDTFKNISRDLYEGAKGFRKDIYIIEDREKAIEEAIFMATENDMVFFTGKGHEKTIQYEDEKIPYDEVKAIKKALKLREEKNLKTYDRN